MGFSLGPIGGGDLLGFAGGLIGNHQASEEARKQRDWAKAMSDTEITRRVADLKNAGLNPMLAVGHMGGASNSGGSAARQENPLASGVALRQQRLLNEAMIQKSSAEAGKAQAETVESASRSAINQQRLAEIVANVNFLNSGTALRGVEKALAEAHTGESKSRTQNIEQDYLHRAFNYPQLELRQKLENQVLGLSMNQHSAESGMHGTWMGQNVLPWIRALLGAAPGLLIGRMGGRVSETETQTDSETYHPDGSKTGRSEYRKSRGKR